MRNGPDIRTRWAENVEDIEPVLDRASVITDAMRLESVHFSILDLTFIRSHTDARSSRQHLSRKYDAAVHVQSFPSHIFAVFG